MSPVADKAVWTGNNGATLHDGTVLISGQTICNVSRGEAEASDHWQPIAGNGKPVKAKRTRTKAKRSKTAPAPPESAAPAPKRTSTAPSESAGTGEAAGSPSEQGEAS